MCVISCQYDSLSTIMFIMSTIMSSIAFCNVMTCQCDSLSAVMFIMSTIMSSIVFCNVMTCQYDSLSIVDKIDVCRMTPPAADDDPILGCHHRLTDRPRLLILQQIIHLRLSFMTQVTGGTDRSHCRHNYVDMVVVEKPQ